MKATSNTKLLKMDLKVHENFAGFGNLEQEVGALLNTGKPQDSSGREDEGASSDEGHAEESEDVVCFFVSRSRVCQKYASFANLQYHLDKGKHFHKLETEVICL